MMDPLMIALLIVMTITSVGYGGNKLYNHGVNKGLSAAEKPPSLNPATPKHVAEDLPTRSERWIMENEHELYPDRDFSEHRHCRVCGPGPLNKYEVPSGFEHVFYKDIDLGNGYTYRNDRVVSGPMEAQLVSSEIEGSPGWHSIMLDIDLPAALIETSTPGHYHLYIDHPIRWNDYLAFLYMCSKIGIIEKKFLKMSKKMQATHLRVPWLEKELAE